MLECHKVSLHATIIRICLTCTLYIKVIYIYIRVEFHWWVERKICSQNPSNTVFDSKPHAMQLMYWLCIKIASDRSRLSIIRALNQAWGLNWTTCRKLWWGFRYFYPGSMYIVLFMAAQAYQYPSLSRLQLL